MFTEGLDDTAISWIKQGSEAEQPTSRSPLTENLHYDFPQPRSPLGFNLPPLKFHSSSLLGPHKNVSFTVHSDSEGDESVGSASDDMDLVGGSSDEEEEEDCRFSSIGSMVGDSNNPERIDAQMGIKPINSTVSGFVAKPSNGTVSGLMAKPINSTVSGSMAKPIDNTVSGLMAKPSSTLNKGLLREGLCVEVPGNYRRFTDGLTGFGPFGGAAGHNTVTGGGSCRQYRERVQFHSVYGTPTSCGIRNNVPDLGTPSAPPIVDIREGSDSEVESEGRRECGGFTERDRRSFDEAACVSKEEADGLIGNGEVPLDWGLQSPKEEYVDCENMTVSGETEAQPLREQTKSLDDSLCYDASGQNAWQTLIAYDACIRLCLNAWARGCTEAPEFLRDECVVLRGAFGLHKLLLQPRGVKASERKGTTRTETHPSKVKKVVGKIRVEVRKLRIIPRRKLKSTYSQRSAVYMQLGAEYVRHVSTLVKTGINTLKSASLPMTCEERFSCLFHLKSSAEDVQDNPGSAICLQPGNGDYHEFFPENNGDALVVDVQDNKKTIQGRAIIPIASLNENPNERIRWWPIYHDDQECVGKVQLSIGSTMTFDETAHIKSGPIVETLAYDLLLEAAMRAQRFRTGNLRLDGPWKWLLYEFSDYYGVSDSYTRLRYLSYVMNVATPTKDCLELVFELLVPIIKARTERSLTRQEKTLLLDCETQVESLLATVFENYKSLDEDSPTGLADIFGSISETAAPALAPAVQVYSLLHDILAPDVQTKLRNYLQTAAAKRCRKHLMETDEFVSNNSEGFLMDSITITTAYLKMKNLCLLLSNEIQTDIKIHNQQILPSSIDLSSITASVYSVELCRRLRNFLSAWPPSSPQLHVNELLVATADFERNLESWNISPVQGGVESKNLYHGYIMVWVQDMQLSLLELCKAEKVPWSGVLTNHSTSPFAEEMYEKMKDMLVEYEVVMNRWPQYSLILENAVANVERAIIKALEKQYSDILTPLKDSIPQRLGMQVQKLTGRQSNADYSVPSQLGTFLNTIKRILDVLHCKVEDILRSWASYLPAAGEDKKSLFGEQMNGITVLLRTKYKNYTQGTVVKLVNNMQSNRNTRLKRILEETKESDGEAQIRERMQMLSSQLTESISNLHEVFSSRIFIATCRGFWDRMGQIVLKFLEGRKENRVWYNGSYYALGILDDTFASQMQRLQGNALQEKDLEPPRSIVEARSILSRDATNATDASTYMYF